MIRVALRDLGVVYLMLEGSSLPVESDLSDQAHGGLGPGGGGGGLDLGGL